ncbi:uncharacterized protein LOC115690383 [Syzygium oleosum]|uniref:uncharacterized protein LOC115690383 n=1 Tax=Syzygium oleosum TaxID=219896 RepID=UPI0011D1A48A|nr:uncharacterized protein LOC115690383 [Syzygium oleosum]XP_056163877.1 uncharacterized protein LOC115690383 [Syzygium oleosum]
MGKPGSRSDLAAKADRKFEKKLQFYAKVRDTVASLSAKSGIGKKKKLRSRQKKLKAYDLSALSEFLPETDTKQPCPPTEIRLSCRSRGKLILKEGKQLSTVLNHPAFQSNPLAAIQQHLESTQPVLDEKPKKKNKTGGKKSKSKKSKAASASQSMEI